MIRKVMFRFASSLFLLAPCGSARHYALLPEVSAFLFFGLAVLAIYLQRTFCVPHFHCPSSVKLTCVNV